MNNTNLMPFFKSLVDVDRYPIVICNLDHIIIYMNPAAEKNYAKYGGKDLLGKSVLNCHNQDSAEKIYQIIDWYNKSIDNNIMYISRNEKKNKDVYMIALRDEFSNLIGYYEKHEYRSFETSDLYSGL